MTCNYCSMLFLWSCVLPVHGLHEVESNTLTYLSGTFSLCQHGANSHFSRLFSTFSPMHQKVVTFGGRMCMLFEICEKRPFQKCMGLGGGGG